MDDDPRGARPTRLRWRRPLEADHSRIAPVLNAWWGGRDMAALLPRLFFQLFTGTSLVVETEDGDLAAFVVALVSQDDPQTGYIHFVGVSPALRGTGLGRELYERTFEALRDKGCRRVKAVTSPVNSGSIAFHGEMGFRQTPPPGALAPASDTAGPLVWPDYDAKGEPRVVFVRDL